MSTPLILRLFGIKINLQKPPLKLDNVITYAYNKLVLFNWGVRSGVGGVPYIFLQSKHKNLTKAIKIIIINLKVNYLKVNYRKGV